MRSILHSAIDEVFNWNNLTAASRKVVRSKGRGGVDGMSVEQWQAEEQKHLGSLRHRLMNDTYRSKPVLRRYIDKPGSKKKRPLGVPAIGDRVCQQAVHRVLAPVFEAYFHDDNHGSVRTAVRGRRPSGWKRCASRASYMWWIWTFGISLARLTGKS